MGYLHTNPLKSCYDSLGIQKERAYKLFKLSLHVVSSSYYFSSQIECISCKNSHIVCINAIHSRIWFGKGK